MDIDPDVVGMVAQLVALNAAAKLLLVVVSYACSVWMLDRLALLERLLDATVKKREYNRVSKIESGQPSELTPRF